ncbi:hypothetical protein [Marinomonas sp.]|uniref:hypothetical protein n=1 Tax=Marinomonas sp. TaxID=1904862 RepID=UPI003A94A4D4
MKINMKGNGTTVINGKSFSASSISVSDGEVIVDGVKVMEADTIVNIEVHGDVEKLSNESGTVKANHVGSIATMSGDVECGDVSGAVTTMSGDVHCGHVGANVSTMSGDIRHG